MDESIRATKVYSKIASAYAKTFSTPSEHLGDFLRIVKHGSILDVGCGPGVDAAYMQRKGFEITAIDFSDEMIKIAKKHPHIDFRVADMRKLRLRRVFDGITLAYSITYIPKRHVASTLKRMAKLLKKDGTLYIALQEGNMQELFLPEPLDPTEKMFLNIISEKEIKRLLHEAGFSILKTYKRRAKNSAEFSFNKYFVIAKKN